MIQKITPKKFVSDKDERLVAANEMILAENVTISERADGSSSILKTMKGTQIVGTAQGEDVPSATWKVVGSVTDDQRSRVYSFVYDTAENSTDHRIVMSEDGAPWVTVFKDEYLNFDEDYPVKADLINKAFQQDGVVQTVMYFTDNNNPPRKINIDRALAGDYTDDVDENGDQISETDIDLDYAILTMRGAPTGIPSFSFEKDEDILPNNFTRDTFQFACQYLYRDGEESALSGYSPLATAPYLASKSLVSSESNSADINACLINIPWRADEDNIIYSDVSKIRLLARSGNSSPFFIIDEFDPNENLTKDVGDVSEKEIYSADTSVYRFYNDGYYANVSDTQSSKLYDNVPQKAEGQTIAASRLLYSNYEEGYPNYDISPSVTLSVNYGAASEFGGDFVGNINNVISYPNNPNGPGSSDAVNQQNRGEVHFDLRKLVDGIDWPTGSVGDALDQIELPGGTKIRLSFRVRVAGSYYGDSGRYYSRVIFTNSNGSYTANWADTSATKIQITNPNKSLGFEVDYTSAAGDTVQDVYDALKSKLNKGNTARYVNFTVPNMKFVVRSSTLTTPFVTQVITAVPVSGASSIPLQGKFYFGTTDLSGIDGVFRMFLSLRDVRPPSGTSFFDHVPTSIFTSSTLVGSGGGNSAITYSPSSNISQASQQVILVDSGYLTNRSGNTQSSGSGPSFKHGSTHDLGIVYYDKWGRNGFVNKIGSVYAKHPSERLPGVGNKGGVSIGVSISDDLDDDAPDWADSYQFVYGGSQYSNVVQYTTGGGYMAMEGSTLVENDHRIYVSLATLEQFQSETGSLREYSFTEGDICRVVSHSDINGNIVYPTANDGSVIEFEVVGVETLVDGAPDANGNPTPYANGEGNPIQWGTPAANRRGTFLVLRAPRVDGDTKVKVLELNAGDSILESASIANGTADTNGDTSDSSTLVVTRDGVDITSEISTLPSFNGIDVTDSGATLTDIDVNAAGKGIKSGDVITFNCTTQSSIEVTITVTSEDLKEEGLKYPGFDWFSVVSYWNLTTLYNDGIIAYPDGISPPATQLGYNPYRNLWGAESVIEILTPKKVSETPIYYEIGERIKIKENPPAGEGIHGPAVSLSEGDVQLRPVSCKSAKYDTSQAGDQWDVSRFKNYHYVSMVLENQSPAEFISEKIWGKGRAHTVFERAATVNRYNSITYSQPYADDTSVLSLSSFVPSQGNFFDLPSEHGACTFLGISSDQLIAMQENKVSRLGLNKDVLETGSQAGVVTISTQLINNLVSYAGDYGTSNPESVLIRDGIVYFADVERRSIVKLSSKGLEVISDKEINSKVESKFSEWQSGDGKTIVSGYDPEDKIYYFTMSPTSEFDGYTLGYDEKGGFWQGSYTFYADRYASLKDRFFGWKYGGGNILHEFKDGNVSNKFFGATSPVASKIRVVSNANPSRVKTYQALSLESNSVWNVKLLDSVGRSTQNVDLSKREGAFYGEVKGLHTSPGYIIDVDDNRYLPVGTIESISTVNNVTVITFANNLRGMNIPANYKVFALGTASNNILSGQMGSVLQGVAKVASVNRSESSITLDVDIGTFANLGAGDNIFVANDTVGLTSDRVRDHYAIIEANYTPAGTISEEGIGVEELYAINVHFSNSPLNDAIG